MRNEKSSSSNQHPLAELDGLRKYIFTSEDGEDFFIRVITSAEEMAKYPDAAMLFGAIRYENQQDLKKVLEQREQHLKNEASQPTHEEIRKWATSDPTRLDRDGNRILGFLDSFGKGDNKTVFILENTNGEPASVTLITINDPKQREVLHNHNDGSLIYVSDVMTAGKYQGKSLFSATFDKIITMLNNDKRSLAKPLEYCVSITADTAVSNDGLTEKEYIHNLPRYAQMWESRFTNNEVQNRWKSTIDGKETGKDKMPLEVLKEEAGKKLDESRIDNLVKSEREKARLEEKIMVRGVYLSGVDELPYPSSKERKKDLFETRNTQFVDKSKRKGWSEDGLTESTEHSEKRAARTATRLSDSGKSNERV